MSRLFAFLCVLPSVAFCANHYTSLKDEFKNINKYYKEYCDFFEEKRELSNKFMVLGNFQEDQLKLLKVDILNKKAEIDQKYSKFLELQISVEDLNEQQNQEITLDRSKIQEDLKKIIEFFAVFLVVLKEY